MIAWLQAHSPREWHGVADSWNWDQGSEIPLWIIRQQDCDAGTAATIFWRCAPEDFLGRAEGNAGIPEYMADNLSIVVEVIARWNSGGYPTRNFSSEGCNNHAYYLKSCVNPDIALPASLCKPFKGKLRADVPGYEEGIPVEVELEVCELLGEKPHPNFLRLHNLEWDGAGYRAVQRKISHLERLRSESFSNEEVENLLRRKEEFPSPEDHASFVWEVIFKRLLDEEWRRKKEGLPYDEIILLQARMAQDGSFKGDWIRAWEEVSAPKKPFSGLGRITRVFGKRPPR
jgi:hypothetical protein